MHLSDWKFTPERHCTWPMDDDKAWQYMVNICERDTQIHSSDKRTNHYLEGSCNFAGNPDMQCLMVEEVSVGIFASSTPSSRPIWQKAATCATMACKPQLACSRCGIKWYKVVLFYLCNLYNNNYISIVCVFDRKNGHDTATILTNTLIRLGWWGCIVTAFYSQDMMSGIRFQIVPNSLSADCKGDLLQ